MTRAALKAEAAAWRASAKRAAADPWATMAGMAAGDVSTGRLLAHCYVRGPRVPLPWSTLSRSLACLWLALECEAEARGLP